MVWWAKGGCARKPILRLTLERYLIRSLVVQVGRASTFQMDTQTKTLGQKGTSRSEKGGQSMGARNEVPDMDSV